jgi:MFS family permease
MQDQKQRIFYGWWIVLACFFILVVAYGTRYYSFGVFFKPMMKEFGWTRATTSMAFTLSTILYGIACPIIGTVVDRFGSRIVIIIGAFLGGAGFASIYFTNSIFQLYIFYSLLMSCGIACTALVPNNAVIANWFTKKRSTATGIVSAGMAVGAFIFVNLAQWMIQMYGWRLSFVIMGVIVVVTIAPIAAFVIRNRPQEMGLLPDGEEKMDVPAPAQTASSKEAPPIVSESTWTLKSAMGTYAFWCISLSYCFYLLTYGSVMVHTVPHATDVGHTATIAAFALSMLTGCSIIGRLGGGWLGDKIDVKYVMAGLMILSSAAVFLFLVLTGIKNAMYLYIFAVLFGIGYGGITPLVAVITAKMFGNKGFGVIYGWVILIGVIGNGVGPAITGYMYDKLGSYTNAFMIGGFIVLIPAVMIALVNPPKLKSA